MEFVATKNYDLNELNKMKFQSNKFIWTYGDPEIVERKEYQVAYDDVKKDDYFLQKYGVLQESLRFTVIIGEDEYAGMAFDVYQGSGKKLSEKDIANFKSFQILMNNYYRVGILRSQTETLKDDIVLSLVRTLELYDSYTGGHSEKVAELSSIIARQLDLPEYDVLRIYWAGIVHDIGKIGVSNEILNKPGRLSTEEYQTVKNHALFGYDILSQSHGLSDIALMVLHHHEWWNGQGYPKSLRGNQIPLASQILHVCDAVDSMAQDRVYRKCLSKEQIIQQLQNGRGSQFSPLVADIMIDYIENGGLDIYKKG